MGHFRIAHGVGLSPNQDRHHRRDDSAQDAAIWSDYLLFRGLSALSLANSRHPAGNKVELDGEYDACMCFDRVNPGDEYRLRQGVLRQSRPIGSSLEPRMKGRRQA